MDQIFLDVETQRLNHEVPGGWDNIPGFGLAVAVTWDEQCGFRTWLEAQAAALVEELAGAQRVIGYNLLRFDYAVLSAYVPVLPPTLQPRTTDMLVDLSRRLGFRPPLESVAQATLGRSKGGDGLAAVRWFRNGEVERVAAYCQEDVALTRDVFFFGQRNGHVFCLDRGRPARVLVRW